MKKYFALIAFNFWNFGNAQNFESSTMENKVCSKIGYRI